MNKSPFLRFQKGENPGDLIPICTCFRSHLANEISCSNCGLQIPQGPTPEFAVRETIKSLEAAEQNEDGSVTQRFGQDFIDMLKRSIGEE